MKSSLAKLISVTLVAAFAAGASAQSNDQKLRDLEKRIDELESREKESFSRSVEIQGRVRPFLNDAISFGGFFETALTGFAGPDTPTQMSAHSHVLGLNIAAQYDDRTRFVAQVLTGLTYTLVNQHNDFRATTPQRQFSTPFFGALVAQAYSEMHWQDLLNVQAGLGYVPFGIAFQQREPVLFRRRGGPQIGQAGSASSVGLAHPLWMGVHVYGSQTIRGSNRWGYHAYTFSPATDTKSLGAGTRLWATANEETTFGFSAQNGSMVGGSFTSVGLDLDRHAEWGGFITEWARNQSSNGVRLAESFYLEPYLHLESGGVILFVAADYLDNPSNTTSPTGVSDPISKWIYGGGVNWLPIPYARFRAGVFTHRYVGSSEFSGSQRRDYDTLELSTGIAF